MVNGPRVRPNRWGAATAAVGFIRIRIVQWFLPSTTWFDTDGRSASTRQTIDRRIAQVANRGWWPGRAWRIHPNPGSRRPALVRRSPRCQNRKHQEESGYREVPRPALRTLRLSEGEHNRRGDDHGIVDPVIHEQDGEQRYYRHREAVRQCTGPDAPSQPSTNCNQDDG